ncbi:MAG TPA: glutathione S-transferase family protein [Acidisphaera sp.]|nr:glutathione S-transferase family protein [Acidisphaera sp.]
MRKIWGRATSSNVMKVIWLCEELALPYERIDAGLTFGVTNTPEYRAMNPTGLVPTLEEDGFTLWESNAICRYLAAANPGDTAVWPTDLRARADIDRWMDAQQTRLNRPQSVVFQGLIRKKPEERDMAAINAAMSEADGAWLMLQAQIERAGGGYVCGRSLTLADIVWGVHVHRWFNMPVIRSDAPVLRAWYDRLLARPAYKTHCAGPVV